VSQISLSKKPHLGAVSLEKRSNGDVPDAIQPRQQAPLCVTCQKKVTKGNRKLANGALSGANDGKSLIARGAFIYQAKRGKTHSLDPTGVDGARTRNPRRDRAVL
jgi:hypothetical protein